GLSIFPIPLSTFCLPMPSADTETILEPSALDLTGDGMHNDGFSEQDHSISKTMAVHKTDRGPRKIWKWKLEGMTLVVLSVIVASVALTLALIISILVGEPQVMPHGAVISESAQCNSIGLQMMSQGQGNAVDAAVATALCMAVVRPDVASLAGCGMMLVQDRNTQKSHLYDFMCSAPSNPSVVDASKPATLVGVPGFVRGLQTVHRNFGQRRWSDLFAGVLNLAAAGFRPDPDLLSVAKATAAEHPGISGMIFNQLAQFSGESYHPPDALKATLQNLKNNGEHYFYDSHSEPASFSSQVLSFLNPQGVNWQARDMSDYTVEKPKPIMMAFAGFTLEAFPSPSSGGSFLLSLLGNLWLKNLRVPLDPGALAKKVPNATATVLHRFIELSKLSEAQALKLGDINDNLIGAQAKAAQNQMLAFERRISTVDSVTDTRTFPPNTELLESPNFKIGDTGILTTDSNTLTVALSLFLGSPFGNGQYVPNTGVHLNAALKLFSTSSGPLQSVLNTIGPKRRPLVPISPIYLSTTHRKCGVRVGITTSSGLWGTIDAAQTIADAALFLRSPPCTPPKGITTPVDDVAASTLLGNKQTSADQPTHMGYSPASDAGCLGFQASSGLRRLRSGPVVQNGSGLSDPVSVEPKFDTNLATGLEGVGHKMSTVSEPWPGRVAVVGWNGYNIISSVDQRGSWKSAQF
ncbi:hypothetical protein CRM22_011420, partial [Opisthorchis felineus]